MEPLIAHKTWRTLEPLHGMIYFVPEAFEEYTAAGTVGPRQGYFASRSAALGEASADLVIATFFNFEPGLVRAAMEGVWEATSPGALVDARRRAADRALRRLLGDDVVEGPAVDEAASIARRAAEEACDRVAGRPLFAGHATLAWPDAPHLVLWHAQTLLREFRGDGHIAALVADGVSPLEALLMHGGTGVISPEALQQSRAWGDEAWTEARRRLIGSGVLNDDGSLSEQGAERRTWVEERTDALAVAPYEAIGEDACNRLRELCRPLSRAVVAGGGVPS